MLTVADGLNLAFNFSRGFRAPMSPISVLWALSVWDFRVPADIRGMGAMIGTTADEGPYQPGYP